VFGVPHPTLEKRIASIVRQLKLRGDNVDLTSESHYADTEASYMELEGNSATGNESAFCSTPASSDERLLSTSSVSCEKPAGLAVATRTNHTTATAALCLPGGFVVDGAIAKALFPHQRDGVAWLW
jgi:hypothetical protein